MSLFSEIGEAVQEVLSDPDMSTADVKIKRRTGLTPGANVWDEPTEEYNLIELNCVVFTAEAEFSAGSLVVERGDEITASPWGTIVEVNGVAETTPFYLGEILPTDVFLVDGDERRVIQIIRTPAAGPDVSVWQIRVVG